MSRTREWVKRIALCVTTLLVSNFINWLYSPPNLSEAATKIIVSLEQEEANWQPTNGDYNSNGYPVLGNKNKMIRVQGGTFVATVCTGRGTDSNNYSGWTQARHLSVVDLYYINKAVYQTSKRIETVALSQDNLVSTPTEK